MLATKQTFRCSSSQAHTVLRQPLLHPAVRSSRSCCKRRPAAAAAAAAQPAASGASGDDEPQQPGSTAITVRPLQASDKPRWLELFRDYIAWYKASVPEDVIELCWQRLMKGGEGNHAGLVAYQEEGGLVVGLAHVLLHRSTWCATHYCYLEDLYVDGKVRAQGVGQALIEAVYALADEKGAPKVYWQTHEQNYRARGLYDKVGRKSQFILYERK
uniref:N-acetyltransferase domain-containing protein n=1 Tax=Tetradesmus obliquus TaxID=3088 RepID=A0A383W009_TETOB|eukprot:jgi/Sobl393_1/18069/SZX71025.1